MGKKMKLGFLAMVGFLGVAAFTSTASANEFRGRVVPAVSVGRFQPGRGERGRVAAPRFARFDRVGYRDGIVRRGPVWNRGGWHRRPVNPYFCR